MRRNIGRDVNCRAWNRYRARGVGTWWAGICARIGPWLAIVFLPRRITTTTKLLIEHLKDLLYELESIWPLKKTQIKLSGSKLLPLIEEISLVFKLDLLLLADLRKLVICHIELFSVNGFSMQLLSSIRCKIWLLVAYKCSR